MLIFFFMGKSSEKPASVFSYQKPKCKLPALVGNFFFRRGSTFFCGNDWLSSWQACFTDKTSSPNIVDGFLNLIRCHHFPLPLFWNKDFRLSFRWTLFKMSHQTNANTASSPSLKFLVCYATLKTHIPNVLFSVLTWFQTLRAQRLHLQDSCDIFRSLILLIWKDFEIPIMWNTTCWSLALVVGLMPAGLGFDSSSFPVCTEFACSSHASGVSSWLLQFPPLLLYAE